MTLTIVPARTTFRFQWSTFTYLPSFIPFGPRTSKIQIFDLWPRLPWPLIQLEPQFVNSAVNLHIPTKFHPNRTKHLEDTDIWPLTPMTLTFDPARTTIRIQWSTSTYLPSFTPIGPRTSKIQIFDLRPRWPWPLVQLEPQFVFSDQPSHTYQVSSQSDQGPRRYRYLTFDPDDLDLWSSSNHNSYSVVNLHIPTKFQPNRTMVCGDSKTLIFTPGAATVENMAAN